MFVDIIKRALLDVLRTLCELGSRA